VLEWFNYPRPRAHPGCEVNCQDVPHHHFMLRGGQPDSGESRIVLQSLPTRSLVAKFPLRTRPWTGVCKPLMPDVVASKAQSQLCKLSGSTYGFNTQEFSMVGGYTENLEKPQNCQNSGVGACSGMGTCSGQYGNDATCYHGCVTRTLMYSKSA